MNLSQCPAFLDPRDPILPEEPFRTLPFVSECLRAPYLRVQQGSRPVDKIAVRDYVQSLNGCDSVAGCHTFPEPSHTTYRNEVRNQVRRSKPQNSVALHTTIKPKPKRETMRSGPNRFGRKGTIRCKLCRYWRRKVDIQLSCLR